MIYFLTKQAVSLSLDNFLRDGDWLLIFKLEVGSSTSKCDVISKYSHNLEKDIKLIIHFFFLKALSFSVASRGLV